MSPPGPLSRVRSASTLRRGLMLTLRRHASEGLKLAPPCVCVAWSSPPPPAHSPRGHPPATAACVPPPQQQQPPVAPSLHLACLWRRRESSPVTLGGGCVRRPSRAKPKPPSRALAERGMRMSTRRGTQRAQHQVEELGGGNLTHTHTHTRRSPGASPRARRRSAKVRFYLLFIVVPR